MFSRIVVGTDGSETAAAALGKAVAIAEMSGGEVIILHAYRTMPAVGDVSGGVATPDLALIAEDAKELLARVERQVSGKVAVRTTLRRGDPARSLIDAAKKEGADLIVVGNRGMRGARRLLGSVPNAVAHGATCDVLIVHTT